MLPSCLEQKKQISEKQADFFEQGKHLFSRDIFFREDIKNNFLFF